MLAISKQNKTVRSIDELRAVVFRGMPKEDERFFRSNIHSWLLADPKLRPSWEAAIRAMVTMINKTSNLKYCYFNDAIGQTVIKMDFQKWAEACRKEIYNALVNQ